MAANTNICRYLSRFFKTSLFLLFLIFSSEIKHAYAATTDATNATTAATNTTTPATTTTTPTTTPIPTTTTIAPNQPRTVIEETAIGQCLCDLTGNSCDINCCCDTDCTEADLTAFKFRCDETSVVLDDKQCFQDQIFLYTNSPARTEKTNDGLFCIYYDNYKDRNYYLDPDFIQDVPAFNDYLDKYADPSLQQPEVYEEEQYSLESVYQAGNPISIVYPDESVGNMVLPTTLGSNQCNDQNTMAYLSEASTQCTRDVALNAQTCTETEGLNAASFFSGFRVVKTPGLFGYVVNGTFVGVTTPPTVVPTAAATTAAATTNGTGTTDATTQAQTTSTSIFTTTPAPSTVDPAAVQTLYDNAYTVAIDATSLPHLCRLSNGTITTCSFTDPPSPTFSVDTCSNVVLEARYVITTNGTFGIERFQVQFVFGDVTQTSFPLLQSYSVAFNSVFDSNNTVDKSGNPGYQLGKYLLYGELNSTSTADGIVQSIITSSDPNLGLTVVRASASGECSMDTSTRIPLRFGENMRTGCLIRFNTTATADHCANLQSTIVQTLEGPNTPVFDTNTNTWIDNNRYVATFGNTPNYKVGDWVRIIVNGRQMPTNSQSGTVTSGTCSLRMGLHIQVLYANVGALANPQPKIVGVALMYDSVRTVAIRCVGAFCQDATSGENQAFEVSQTVSFVDVSQPAVKYQGEAPIFIARVPNDFFYPFLFYSNGASASVAQVTVSVLISVLVTVCLHVRLDLL